MKIYSRTDFMELPAGVVYAKGKQWYFTEWCVKGETIRDTDGTAIDWGQRDLIHNFAHGDSLAEDDMLERGVSYWLDDAYGRDGCFDNDDVFLVYEIPDLIELLKVIEQAGKVSHEVV